MYKITVLFYTKQYYTQNVLIFVGRFFFSFFFLIKKTQLFPQFRFILKRIHALYD